MRNTRLAQLEQRVRPYYELNGSAHRFDHVERVRCHALLLAQSERGVDQEALLAMVLLHDVVRFEDERENQSPERSAEIARQILPQLGFSLAVIAQIESGVRSHSIHSRQVVNHESREAELLFDADKLDAVGRFGIFRWLTMAGARGLNMEQAARGYLEILATKCSSDTPLHSALANRLFAQKRLEAETFFTSLLTSDRLLGFRAA